MKEAIKRAVAEAAETYGAEGYEIKIGSATSAAVEALKDDISSVTYEKSTSISVRCVKGGKSGYASGNIVTPEEASELAAKIINAPQSSLNSILKCREMLPSNPSIAIAEKMEEAVLKNNTVKL